MLKKFHVLNLLLVCCLPALAQVAPVAQSVKGRVICGYQAWFNAYGDGSPVARWRHWSAGQYNSNNGSPAPGAISFEAYPDVKEYPAAVMFQTNLGNTHIGNPAKLFTSWQQQTINLHFSWMQQHGIDGAALQRFLGETRDGVFKSNRDSVTVRLRRAAEQYQRSFYIMYDMSADDTTYFKNDWLHIENNLGVVNSPYYAHQDGKPVICLWGFGFTGRPNVPAHSIAIINWLKAKGYYVIGGVPTHWRTSSGDSHPGYSAVYDSFDMLSPWSVGRFNSIAGADNFKNNHLVPDLAYCNTNGIDYQPVIFPGFAWSNWNGGPVNEISRAKGEFFWRQVYNLKNMGFNTAYIAMFDEYDEATNIMKMADSYFDVPHNQYFLTSSADGSYLSSDFYLRLAGQATNVLKGNTPLSTNVNIPFSVAPLWFRTSVQPGYDAMPSWTDSPDPSSVPKSVLSPLCGVVTGETSFTGNASLRIGGTDNASSGGSYHYFRVFDVNIPVNAGTRLTWLAYPTNNLSRYVSVDLVMTDGSNLRDAGATDVNGVSMHPGAGRGTVNAWQKQTCYIGNWLNGKTIDRIMIAYDRGADVGAFKTYIDDIVIKDTAQAFAPAAFKMMSEEESLVKIFPQPAAKNATVVIQNWNGSERMELLNAEGKSLLRQQASSSRTELPVQQYPAGIYYLRVEKNGKFIVKKLIIAR
jgi:hypothetical protein